VVVVVVVVVVMSLKVSIHYCGNFKFCFRPGEGKRRAGNTNL